MKRPAYILVLSTACAVILAAGVGPAARPLAAGAAVSTAIVDSDASVAAASMAIVQASASSQASADFLNVIGIPAAWRALDRDVTGTIAIVDTGVDLNHPVLSKYLTDGVNLLDSRKPPDDDNGHGTAVAGILAQIAEAAEASSASSSWKMKIMPIKALNNKGEGSEISLVRGIQYAIDKKADIVVLSLGLRRDAPEMRKVVELAEQAGVLLVAAGGNDAADFGKKAAIQYPAAYPTVLGVGGTTGTKPQAESTPGSEIDLAAPWRVSTFKPGGGTLSIEGTSMGAPQVAGAAALLKAAKPGYTPAQIRDTLRRTAQDVAAKGWDPQTGYGIVRADLAAASDDNIDWREPDDSRQTASAFPLGAEVMGVWSYDAEWDYYWIDVPYDGELTVSWETNGRTSFRPNLLLSSSGSTNEISPFLIGTNLLTWQVSKGRYYLKTNKGGAAAKGTSFAYRLESRFGMSADAMEPNGSPLRAFTLSPRTQSWTGNFDHTGDEDWVQINLPKDGKLRITVEPSTTRIDPAIHVEQASGEGSWTKDDYGDGRSEQLVLTNASSGKYYIQVRNAVSENPEPVIGTYTVQLEYITPYVDPHEPNDTPLKATVVKLNGDGSTQGLISTAADKDWYRFTISDRESVSLQLTNIPSNVQASLKLYDKGVTLLTGWSNARGKTRIDGTRQLPPGTYYVLVEADAPIQSSYYGLTLKGKAVAQTFNDVEGHWAEQVISAVVKKGWMAGYADGSFRPDRQLTRSEAIVIAVRAFQPANTAAKSKYADVPASNWAYDSIVRAEAKGWLSGFGTLRLEPGRALTRGEAAMLVANAAGLTQSRLPQMRFLDVPTSNQAAAAIDAMVRKGWLSGYGDGTFRPDATITRAEWAALMAKLL